MSLADRDGYIWMDGQFVPWREATVHCLTHTLHYGCGAYEGIRAYTTDKGSAIFRLQDHTDRLFDSIKIIRIDLPFDKKTVFDAAIETVKKNNLTDGAYIRDMVFLGPEAFSLGTTEVEPHIIIAAWKTGAYIGEEQLEKGAKICTSSFTKHHFNSMFCLAKTNGNYVNGRLAALEAKDNGCDEALLLDHMGFVAEGPGENIFIIKNDVIYTPFTTSALSGITRDTLMTIARDQGYEVIEKQITRDFIYTADEAFFTGTAAEVTPIRELDRRTIGNGSRGPVTEKLQKRYFDCVQGRLPEYDHWLTHIV